MKNRLFTIVFGLATLIGIFLISCESDLESTTKIASEKQQQNSNFNLREVTLEEISTKFNPIKEKFKLGKHLKSKKDAFVTTQFRTGDDSEIIIYTDNIKEITQGDYTSYTMYMQIPDSLPNNFYNITIEEQNGDTSLFVTKYTTTNNWLENQTQPFEGEITTFRLEGGTSSSANEFLDADTIDDLMGGGGGGSTGTSSGTTTSNTYPWNCDGIVHTTIFIEPKICSENIHWPWSPGNCIASVKPRFEETYQYECIPNDDGSTAGGSSSDGDNTGGAPGGGSSTPSDGNGDRSTSTSLTVIVGSEQECIASPADLNNDCAVDYDEAQFYTFYTGLTPQQQVVVDTNTNKRRFFTYLKGNGFSVDAINFAIELIDYELNSEVYVSPDIPITDFMEYIECLDLTQGATITIYADQPVSNSSNPYSLSPFNVGHAFLGISQGQEQLSLGFYPENGTGFFNPTNGILGNDENHSFDVSITINIDAQTLGNILALALDYSVGLGNFNYDLNSNNCTDFMILISNQSGLNAPDCFGTWPLGGGSNPGSFGQYLRDVELPNGVTRNINGGNSPSNHKGC